MLRTLRRWFSDSETRALHEEVRRAQDQVLSLAHKLEGLDLRIERLVNRVNVRMTRAGLPKGDRDEALEELQELGGAPRRDEWPGGWPG